MQFLLAGWQALCACRFGQLDTEFAVLLTGFDRQCHNLGREKRSTTSRCSDILPTCIQHSASTWLPPLTAASSQAQGALSVSYCTFSTAYTIFAAQQPALAVVTMECCRPHATLMCCRARRRHNHAWPAWGYLISAWNVCGLQFRDFFYASRATGIAVG
jgi:hypothetical protein